MGVNGVPMAPHGLILGENEATPSRKVFKHLPDLKTAINLKQITKNYVWGLALESLLATSHMFPQTCV